MHRPDFDLVRRLVARALRFGKAAPALAGILAADAAKRLRRGAGQTPILLHAGGHKTGTKSIQSVLLAQRKALKRQGFHVPRAGQGTDGAHHRLIRALLGGPRSAATMALLRAELRRAASGNVLISSEMVKKYVVEGEGARLIDAFRRAGAARVRLLLYVRSPFALASSSYSSRTSKLGLAGAEFDRFLRDHDNGPDYRYDRFLELARRDDVELVVRPYSASARRTILGDFAETLDLDLPREDEPRHNMSFGPIGLEAMRVIAAEAGPLPEQRRMRLWPHVRRIARLLGEQPFWGVDERREASLATADRRTEEFARAVWGRGWREVIGEERHALNIFDPADPSQQALLEAVLREMRDARMRILG